MVGYYTERKVHESFVAIGQPAPSNVVNPKTGHTLINTFVSSYWEAERIIHGRKYHNWKP
jgi:hypothetical protein